MLEYATNCIDSKLISLQLASECFILPNYLIFN